MRSTFHCVERKSGGLRSRLRCVQPLEMRCILCKTSCKDYNEQLFFFYCFWSFCYEKNRWKLYPHTSNDINFQFNILSAIEHHLKFHFRSRTSAPCHPRKQNKQTADVNQLFFHVEFFSAFEIKFFIKLKIDLLSKNETQRLKNFLFRCRLHASSHLIVWVWLQKQLELDVIAG